MPRLSGFRRSFSEDEGTKTGDNQYVSCLYLAKRGDTPEHFYTGMTANLDKRLEEHNSGKSIHTNKFKPWKVRTYITFDNKERAEKFETYLKTSSGRAFMTKRF